MFGDIEILDFELTNRCNAACPLCPRTGTFDGLSESVYKSGMMDIPLDTIKHIVDSCDSLQSVMYCGNYGDPLMHPNALEVFEYVKVKQTIHTNGGIQNESFWERLGELDVRVVFGIDGLEDTNHIYRKNVRWDKLMRNAQAFIDAGGDAVWQFIPFSHNEHQVEEARRLSMYMGFDQFVVKKSARQFTPNNKTVTASYKPKRKDEQIIAISAPEEQTLQSSYIHEGIKESSIICKSLRDSKVYIGCDSSVVPCCWVGDIKYTADYLGGDSSKYIKHNVIVDPETNPLEDILRGYQESEGFWRLMWSERKIQVCNKKCGSNKVNENEKSNL